MRLPQADDAVGGEPTGEIAFFKNSDGVATPCEFTGTGQARCARTNHGYSSSGRCRFGDHVELPVVDVIHRKSLQPADHNRLVFRTEHARTLTQLLHRTHAGAGGAEKIRFENGSG